MPRYYELDTRNPLMVASDLLSAFEQLHNVGRVHNDLKPDNVMTTKNGGTVLIDMGYCKKYSK